MKDQVDLNGKSLTPPWQGVCSQACWEAKEERCRCQCKGVHHGVAHKRAEDPKVSEEQCEGHHPDNCPPTIMWYNGQGKATCPTCGFILSNVKHFADAHGWLVLGFKERQSLFRHCDKCGYDWSLSNLGVSRQEGEPLAQGLLS